LSFNSKYLCPPSLLAYSHEAIIVSEINSELVVVDTMMLWVRNHHKLLPVFYEETVVVKVIQVGEPRKIVRTALVLEQMNFRF
jgi:hypothetical protein